jgi:DNA-cytosine methyltransferase
MKILSLFDGISCARIALDKTNIPVEMYYASEIDKYAISISQKNYPDIIQIGDVKDISSVGAEIDLLIGGSPCQDLSIAKKNRQGLDGARSGLFWEYVRILNDFKPKYFILENVASMPKEAKRTITEALGVEPIMINAALVSAQNRKRLFWVGKWNGKKYEQVIIPQPEDKGILLKDILEIDVDEKFYVYNKYNDRVMTEKCGTLGTCMGRTAKQGYQVIRIGQIGKGGQGDRIYSPKGKSVNLSANGGGRGAKTGLYAVALTETRTEEAKRIRRENMKNGIDYSPRREKELKPRGDEKANTITTGTTKESLILQDTVVRKLTPVECERLQSLPDNYTEGVSNTQRYKALGNGFNVEVISHILKYLL